MFVAALVCAGIATLLVRFAMMDSSPAPEVKASAAAMRSVVVATRSLIPGEKVTPDVVREVGLPAENIPRGSFETKEALFKSGDQQPLILSSALGENEPILAQKLQGPAADNGLAGRLNPDMRGITIRVNEASSVGGFAQPEDRVDVLMTQLDRPGEGAAGTNKAYTKTLVRNVRVLAADQQVQRKPQAQPPKTVTLEVSEEDAKKLTLAGAVGQLSLTLNRGIEPRSMAGSVRIRDIGEEAADSKGVQDVTADTPVVSVFRSGERKEYKVPQE